MNKFAKNVAIMSVAPMVTQALSLLITPVVTRLYTPDNFGAAALFGSLVMPFAVFANMGYNSAIVVPEKEEEASNLFVLSVFFTILVSILSLPLVLLKNSTVLLWFHVEKIGNYLWLLPISIFFHGLYMSFRYLNIRRKRFGYISAAKIFRFITTNGIYLLAGFTGFASGFFLILGDFLGGVTATGILNKSLWKSSLHRFMDSISVRSVKAIARKYSKYPKFILLNDLISRVSGQMPIYLFSFYFSSAIVGYYALGLRLLTIPVNFLGSSIGEVFFQEASSNRVHIPIVLEKLFKYLVLLGLPVFIFLGLIGEDIFHIILGKNWSEAGIYVQILSLYMFSRFITIPASYLMLIFDKQEFSVYLNIATTVISVVSLVIGGLLKNVYIALILFSTLNGIIYLVYGFCFMRFVGLKLNHMFQIVIIKLLTALPFVALVLVVKIFFNRSSLIVLILSTVALIIYYLILLVSSKEIRVLMYRFVGKVRNKFMGK